MSLFKKDKDTEDSEGPLDPNRLGERAAALRDHLTSRVIGQDHACEAIVNQMTNFFGGFNPPNRPLCCILCIGPSGSGKTLLAQAIAEHISGSADRLYRIDCAEFQERHEISAQLLGSPSGYVGYYDDALLSETSIGSVVNPETKRLDRPFVILLDEIDKVGSQAFYKILLAMFDRGSVKLKNGKTVSFKDAIVICTSNHGTAEMNSVTEAVGFKGTEKIHKDAGSIADRVARKSLPVELINRFDGIVTFNSLSKEDISIICEIELGRLQQRVRQGKTPFLFSLTEGARNEICREGYSTRYNARELRRTISKRVEQPLANCVSSGQIATADVVTISYDNGEWIYKNCGSCKPLLKELRADPQTALVANFLLPAAPSSIAFPTFGPRER